MKEICSKKIINRFYFSFFLLSQLNKFDVIISGDDTEKGKPNPEPYLAAMQKLNILPIESLVIENAPLGIQSAKTAGAYCIAITTTLGREYLKEADEVVKNHRELFVRLIKI